MGRFSLGDRFGGAMVRMRGIEIGEMSILGDAIVTDLVGPRCCD